LNEIYEYSVQGERYMTEPYKILVVEDERIVAEDIKEILESLEYEVLAIVSSGQEAIEKSSEDIFLDKKVKRLATTKTYDNQVLGGQILAHDMLILCFVINSPENHSTDTPDQDWKRQLEINIMANKVVNIYSHGTVFQTITNSPQQVLEVVKNNLSVCKNKKPSTTKLPFGQLWQFGVEYNYLLTIEKQNEEIANKFLANNFAYMLTIVSKIDKHYLLAIELYKEISKQEELVNELDNDFEKILANDDLAFLEKKAEELKAISKNATNNITYLKDCSNNIQSNIINLKDALKNIIFDTKNDGIFYSNLELYEEHVQNIDSWVNVCESSLMRINKTYADASQELDKKIEKLRTEIGLKEAISTLPSFNKPEMQVSLEWGNSYIMNENELDKSLAIFTKTLELGNSGLCITRTHPDKLKKDLKFENITMKWLSKDTSNYSIPPVLGKLSHTITEFFRENPRSVLLLDGLEYLKTNNDFEIILKFTDHLKDLVYMYNNTLLLPISFKTFSEYEITLIKKNMVEITDAEIDVEGLIS